MTDSLRRACLGMPGYGHLTAGASRGLWRASRGPAAAVPLDLAMQYQEGSLLAQNFNALWCWPLNECHQGRPVDYFAMLHADVEPDDFWLDTLIEELEANDLDVLGTVVPIKDPKGLTSLALAREDGDTWRPHCRLTLAEIHRLPETFTSDDLGYPLLLNTGCWVCKFDPPWASQVHFEINDRIAYDQSRGLYVAQVEPEDWYFSRLLHELGLKVGATRKLGLEHAGSVRYTNRRAWGTDAFDTAYVRASPVPDISQDTRLVIGLGTGRCGTRSLTALLGAQPGTDAAHERCALRWEGEPDPGRVLEQGRSSGARVFADVGFYYLPHVRRLLAQFPSLRCVCLKRDRQQTIDSFRRQLPRAAVWFDDRQAGWSRSFPSYRMPFQEAVGHFWDDYYFAAAQLQRDYPERFRIFPTEALNDEAQCESLLRFAGYDQPVVQVGIRESDR